MTLEKVLSASIIALDVETTGFTAKYDKVTIVGVASDVGSVYFEPNPIDLELLQDALQHPTKTWVMHNSKFDVAFLVYSLHLPFPKNIEDTMIIANLLEPAETRIGLKELAKSILKLDMMKYEDAEKKARKENDFSILGEYCKKDCEATLGLYNHYKNRIAEIGVYYYGLELKLIPVLLEMEQYGILIDTKKLHNYVVTLEDESVTLSEGANEYLSNVSGKPMNINLGSTKQIGELLYVNVPNPPLTETGKPKVGVDELEEWSKKGSYLAEQVLKYRKLIKLKGYCTQFIGLQREGVLHTSFSQTGVTTGRVSSRNPALQNLPVWREEDSVRIREALIARPGHKFLMCDYSQIELRLIAEIANETTMLKTFEEGGDIHQATADKIGCSRKTAKIGNFGIIYGATAHSLARQLDISLQEAENFYASYFKQYSGIREYINSQKAFVKKYKYVETMFGRRVYLPEIDSKNFKVSSYVERQSINIPIQGSAADLLKIAMITLHKKLPEGAHIINQIHDEIMVECRDELVDEMKELIMTTMKTCVGGLRVPLLVDCEASTCWDK